MRDSLRAALARRRVLLLLPALAGIAACGGTSVGNNDLFTFTPIPSTAAAATPSSAATPPPTAPPHTAAPKATPAPTPPPQTITISIVNDASGYFNPAQAEMYTGTVVTFTNHDTVARSVKSRAGDPASFDSGSIAPGASWSYNATTPGTFNYVDGTRPYATGSFTVISR